MYIVGLTGNVASGKSTVSDLLTTHGVYVIDADKLAATALQDAPVQQEICATFGETMLRQGALNKEAMREQVFAYLPHLRQLEAIVHQPIRTQVRSLLQSEQAHAAPYVVVAVPLLFETGWNHFTDATVLVRGHQQARRERLAARGVSEAAAKSVLDWQMPAQVIQNHSNYQIINNSSLDALAERTNQVHSQLLGQATTTNATRVNRLSF